MLAPQRCSINTEESPGVNTSLQRDAGRGCTLRSTRSTGHQHELTVRTQSCRETWCHRLPPVGTRLGFLSFHSLEPAPGHGFLAWDTA